MGFMLRFANRLSGVSVLYRHVPADLIIGVDREGIIEASMVAKAKGIPYGLISYEITFEEEAGLQFKEPEIAACKDISFAACQDALRAEHLAKENRISPEKIINVPLGGRGAKRGRKVFYLHDKLGIDRDIHIVLYIGSVAAWAGAYDLFQSASDWPDEWVLVVHPRYGHDDFTKTLLGRFKDSPKIIFSLDSLSHYSDLFRVIKSADIGAALYMPTTDNVCTGNNIKYIGMASGKVAMYLQHGIPVIINEIGILSDYVRKYKLGFVINDTIKPPPAQELGGYAERCYEFFERKMDLDKTSEILLSRINDLL
jgi:glycosyltransferase involved in cell wall biosynthesis